MPTPDPDVRDAARESAAQPETSTDVVEPEAGEDASAPDVVSIDAQVASDASAVSDVTTSDVRYRDESARLLLPRCETTEPAGPVDLPTVASTLVNTIVPIATRVSVANPLKNPSHEDSELEYRMRGMDRYRQGPGEAHVTRRDLGGSTAAVRTRASLSYFVQVSDFQLTDDESPTRLAATDNPLIGAGNRPQEAYIPRVMSALNRSLAELERRSARSFDFGVFAGDCADSGQLNELQWFIDIMDGVRGVHTDSGADDDPVPGPNNDPKDPFDPSPFPAPWLYVPGNHDVMITGLSVPNMTNMATATGTNASGGTRDYSQWYAPVVRGTVVRDPQRRPIERTEIIRQLYTHSSVGEGPVGHGFPPMTDVRFGANYVRDLIPGTLRMLAFDTSDPTGGSKGMVLRQTIDNWLRPELERGTREGVLMMIVSHHPLDSIDRLRGELGPLSESDAVSASDVQNVITNYPNMILWLVGHQHDVRVRAIRGPDTARPGFWEVQSGSIADWPGQARIMEFVANDNGTLSLYGTLFDYSTQDCMERRFRRLALMDFMSGWDGEHRGTPMDRNVELIVPIPTAARTAVMRAMTSAPARIESLTTLRGM